jgi:transcriptional regulator with XRE-family HTH domain
MYRFDGLKLRRLRVAKRIRPETMAARLGRSLSTLTFYEKGRIDPPLRVLCQICEVLDCSPEDLLTRAAP